MSYLEENLRTKIPLKCNADGKFKILMVSDVHGRDNHNPRTAAAFRIVVENVKPDLVLIGGDTIHNMTAENDEALLEKIYEFLKDLTEVLEENKIPWAHVFGNHDWNCGLTNAQQQPAYERFEHNISKRGPQEVSGMANYVLPIKSHDGKDVIYNVWGLDSHDTLGVFANDCNNPEILKSRVPNSMGLIGGSDTLRFDQLIWYWNSSVEMEQHFGRKIPGMMFFHVPVPEFRIAPANPVETNLQGHVNEGVGAMGLNSGLFAEILQRGDIKTICCGHDHNIDFSAKFCGIDLCFDGGLSFDGYCLSSIRGGRVFEIDEKDPWNINTYMVHYKDMTDNPDKYLNT